MRFVTLSNNQRYEFDQMKIMGILNATPDSFYADSRLASTEAAVMRGLQMIEEGADILDIGGESTRPGSEPVSEQEELARVIPVICGIRKRNTEVLISIDTYRATTAEAAVLAGADIINDISAMTFDDNMIKVAVKYGVPVILMHIKGTPKDMQQNPVYEDVFQEVKQFFEERVGFALSNGMSKDKLILDPGIGFGKQYEHNLTLMKRTGEFGMLGLPVLLAVSRKSTIGTALGNLPPEERLEGTIAVTCHAALNGVDIVRVHDVKENKRAAKMMEVLI